jgi:hypothetical protein
VQGNYAAAGVVMQIPVFTGGLLSARQDEALLQANAAQKSLEDTEIEVVSRPMLACLGLALGRAGRRWGVDAWLAQWRPSSFWW